MFPAQLRYRMLAIACSAAFGFGFLALCYFVGWPPRLPAAGDLVLAAAGAASAFAVALAAASAAVLPLQRAIMAITDAIRPRQGDTADAEIPREIRKVLPRLAAAVSLFKKRIQANIDVIQESAELDVVTNLPNRMSFRRAVERYLRQMQISRQSCAILFIDLDRFKSVNDSLGHAQGDVLLTMFAARMRVLLSADARRRPDRRGEAVLARLAGDEFTMLLPDIDGPDDARKLAARVLRSLQDPFEFAGQSIVIGASIGICVAPMDGDNYETLMRNADTAMYHAKDRGRNQYYLFEAEMHERVRDRLQLESRLRGAIAGKQFELFYQPQIASDSGALVSAEALIRWHHPEKGLSGPAAFIDIAEDSGMIVELGRWVMAEATRRIAEWARAGWRLRVSINVSPQQLERADFTRHLRDCLDASHAPAELLELEITESTVMTSDPAIVQRLSEARALGITIAIDDFGTGYSNLARLKDLPIDRLKIDRSLVKDVAVSADARTIIQAIVGLAGGLGYECVAEGVETEIQADILGVIGCEILQGYWISRPVNSGEFEIWAAAHTRRQAERASRG
jgi:diguanylate cyclase (GGDEF)-like protein